MSTTPSFADLGAPAQVVDALAERGITQPFPIQAAVLADALAGRDILGRAPTGSGKTLAFGIPVVARMEPGSHRRPTALILSPTRELAEQIADELRPLAEALGHGVAALYGGVGYRPQQKALDRGASLIVACPGRLEDLLQRGAFTLDHVRHLVLDEADRMLDMGFKPSVDRIVKKTPADRQTLFFSATLEGAAGRLASAYTRSPRTHANRPEPEKAGRIEHRFIHLSHQAKVETLLNELENTERGRTLVFVRTKHGADRLVKKLGKRSGIRAAAMHGNKSQNQRQRALADFERGRIDTLVATDVAARGIDVAEVTHVIHYDVPEDRDTFVHRSGRTARAGADGIGISFVLADQHNEMRKIASSLGLSHEYEQSGGPVSIQSETRTGGHGGGKNRSGGNPNRANRSGGRPGGPKRSGNRSGGGRRRKGKANAVLGRD
jgi:superfamily II DNA/RNA helicase